MLFRSLIKAFACPRLGHLLAPRMDGKPHGLASPGPARVGQAVHRFIMNYFMACRKADRQTDLAAGTEIAQAIAAGFDLSEWAEDFAGICEQVMNSEMAPRGEAVILEKLIHCDEYFGTPDMVQEFPALWAIHDWKTKRRIPTQSEIEADIQLPFYAWLFQLQIGEVERYDLYYHYVRYGVVRKFTMDSAQVAEFGQRIRKRCEAIKAMTEWPAVPGEACTYCEDALDCPAAVAPLPGASRGDRAGRLRAMKRMVEALTKELKADVEVNGPIEIGGEVLDFYPVEKKTFTDVRQVYDLLAGEDIPPEQVWAAMGMTQADARRLCKGNKQLWKRLEALADKKTETWFKFKGEE